MKEVDRRTQVLTELSGSLGFSDMVVKTNELKKTRPYWRNQAPGDHRVLDEEAVDVVIPPHGNVAMQFRFIIQLEKILDDYNSHGNIIRMVPSSCRGTVMTVSIKLSKLNSLLDKLGDLPEVEKAEEIENELSGQPVVPIFSKRFEFLTRSGIKPSKRVRVTLKESDRAESSLATTRDTHTAIQERIPVLSWA